MKVKSESEVAQSCPTLSDPWTAAYQAPLSMGFSRQEDWSGVPLPSPTYIFSNSIGGFPCAHALSPVIVCSLFEDGHSDWCKVILRCSFDLQFSNNERCGASFHVLSRKKKKTVFVTYGDVLRLISWRSTLFWIVFLFFFFLLTHPRTLLEGKCPLQFGRPCEFQGLLHTGFQAVVIINVHKAAALLHVSLRFLGQQVLWRKSCSWAVD